MEKINTTIEKAKKEVSDLIVQAQHNQMKAQPGATQQESFEREVNRVLNKARDDAGLSATGSLRETNNIKTMVVAGEISKNFLRIFWDFLGFSDFSNFFCVFWTK